MINVENRNEILRNALAVIDGRVYRPVYSLVDDVLFAEDNSTITSASIDGDGVTIADSTCESGGGFVFRLSGEAPSNSGTVDIDGCRIGEIVFDGRVTRGNDLSAGTVIARSVDLVVTRSGDTVSLASNSVDSELSTGVSSVFEVSRYESNGPDGTVLIEGASSMAGKENGTGEPGSQSAMFRAKVTAAWTGGEVLDIRTDERFSVDASTGIDSNRTSYTSGVLVVEAADGSRLTLDAGNGDPASFTLTVEADGGVSSFTVPVGENLQIPCVDGRAGDSDESLICTLVPGLPI